MATVQFEYDPERLIEEVKKRPGIWDFEDAEYKSKIIRYKLWSAIVTELMGKDVQISKSELRELELQLQKKWKSMRDCFQKYITNPGRSRRPYLYTKQLQFLLKNTQKSLPKRRESSESDDGQKIKTVWKSKRKFELTKESSDEDNDTYNNEESISADADIILDTPNKIANTNKTAPDDFVFASVDSYRSEAEDLDKMFLISLLPHLKSIPEDYRLSAKMELMQVLRNYHSGEQKGVY